MSCSRATASDLVDAVDDPFQPLAAVDLGVALAGEDPADRARTAQPPRHGDQVASRSTARLRAVGVGVREVGRAAEHRHREARRGDRLADAVEIAGSRLVKKPSYISRPSASSDAGHARSSRRPTCVRSPAIWSM